MTIISVHHFRVNTNKHINTNKPILVSRPPEKSFTTIPNFKGVSEKIKRVLNAIGVKVALKPLITMGKLFPSLERPLGFRRKILFGLPGSLSRL